MLSATIRKEAGEVRVQVYNIESNEVRELLVTEKELLTFDVPLVEVFRPLWANQPGVSDVESRKLFENSLLEVLTSMKNRFVS